MCSRQCYLVVFQSLPFLKVSGTTFHYDCMAAGKALSDEWAPDGLFMQKVQDLQNWLDRVVGATLSCMNMSRQMTGMP